MPTDFERPPDYDALVVALIEKTKVGKLDWQETASPNLFIAAVKGKQTFEVDLVSHGVPILKVVLRVKDEEGKQIFETPPQDFHVGGALDDLFSIARRVAMHLDERIGASIDLVQTL